MTYYKVVHQSSDGLTSITLPTTSPACVIYHVGQWVKPNGGYGPLYVFRGLEDACNFFSSDVKRKVFSCEIRESSELWIYQGRQIGRSLLPDGTVLASKVKLIEEVECDE